ncbi:unnamed protein product [Peronospora destructor]|uniref:RxLR effector protein n=1 Tax=Peronospora destructor TaxID=86335 RepID=A0AAV0VB46_9STRA|nr:unnamed protein product [Peronospora destructor]
MRFSVLVALFAATFVASCGSFISAETKALDDNMYNSNEVARHLRGDNEVQEERAGGMPNPGMVSNAVGEADGITRTAIASLKSVEDIDNLFGTKGLAKLEKKGIIAEKILEKDPETIKKLAKFAVKGAKGNKGFLRKSMEFGLMTAGVVGLLYILYCWTFKASSNTPADSTAKSESTTPASA